jgi:xylan 1,4-beta-xylosidase
LKNIIILVFACITPFVAWGDEQVIIDASAPHHSFPHYWEQMFGSGRAILTLRDSYRRDLRLVIGATDLKFVRFHAILHDEVGVYDEDKRGAPTYNFSYVDQIYDGLLENGVRPFVELSFMPRKLAAREAVHSFKYHPIVARLRQVGRYDSGLRSTCDRALWNR